MGWTYTYAVIKQHLRKAETHVAVGQLEQADVEVRKAIKLGASRHDLSVNLSREAMKKLHEWEREK